MKAAHGLFAHRPAGLLVCLLGALLHGCVPLPPNAVGQKRAPIAEAMARVLESVHPAPAANTSPPELQPALQLDRAESQMQADNALMPIDVEVEAVPARLLFSSLSQLAGMDVVADQHLSGRVSLQLAGQPWLETVRLAAWSLGWKMHFNRRMSLVRIMREDCLLPCTQRLAYPLQHREAAGMVTALQRVLQGVGGGLQVAADAASNSIILSGNEEAVDRAVRLVDALDRRRPVVLVEAWVLEIGDDSQRLLGMDWGLQRRDLSGGLDGEGHRNLLQYAPADTGAAVIARRDRDGLALRLAALARQGYTRILSNPRIWVVEGETAEIFQGDEVPYTVRTDEGGSHTQFRQAGLGLKVRPRVKRSGRIELDLQISKDTVDRSRENPPISRREMRTKLIIEPGEAALIGGISSAEESGKRKGLPGFGAVGGLGEQGKDSAQLLVVLSARVPDAVQSATKP